MIKRLKGELVITISRPIEYNVEGEMVEYGDGKVEFDYTVGVDDVLGEHSINKDNRIYKEQIKKFEKDGWKVEEILVE